MFCQKNLKDFNFANDGGIGFFETSSNLVKASKIIKF
jgi:hypothetical protein